MPEEPAGCRPAACSDRAADDRAHAGRAAGRAGAARDRRCQTLRRVARGRWRVVRGADRLDPRGDRAERRRQDHAVPYAEGRNRSHLRGGAAVRPPHHRAGGDAHRAAWHRQEQPAQPVVSGTDRGENLRIAALARRRGMFRADLLRGAGSIPAVERQVSSGAADRRVGAPRRCARPCAAVWGETAAGDRYRAGHRPQRAAAGRAAGRHEPGRTRLPRAC